jgi:hypothetical protein
MWHMRVVLVWAAARLRRLKSQHSKASLDSLFFCFLDLAPSREALLLAPEMRASFQFVVLTGIAVEENDLLLGFADFRHGVSPSVLGATLTALAFWTHDAEASASSDASASCYRFAENVGILPVIVGGTETRSGTAEGTSC